ncbi:hypothetical protein ACFL08_03080, partial [Patescibacteria group bacterium]
QRSKQRKFTMELAEELKKPEVWEKELDARALDPDGWRMEKLDWNTPVTRKKFEELIALSTIRHPVLKNRK